MSFLKALNKKAMEFKSSTINLGFFTDAAWTSSGSLALNRLLTGNHRKAIQFGKTVVIGGESGSGKSLILATAAREAQKDLGAQVIWLDSEKASEEDWFVRTGMDLHEDKFSRIRVATIDDVKMITSAIVKSYDDAKAAEAKGGPKQPPLFVVIDSYSMLMTDSRMENTEKGKVVGDQGQQAKQLKELVVGLTHLIDNRNIAVCGVVHTMVEGDGKYKVEKFLGGRGLIYAASVAFIFTKNTLKAEDTEDKEALDGDEEKFKVIGFRATAKLYKSRYTKPNEKVEMQVPWETGVDRYSGLFEMLLDDGDIMPTTKGSSWYQLREAVNGVPAKFQKSSFREHADAILNGLYPDEDAVDLPAQVTEEEE